jgi:hypothetical protein
MDIKYSSQFNRPSGFFTNSQILANILFNNNMFLFFIFMYYYILYMSGYPLLNYNFIDSSGNTLPIVNSCFAYGTLGKSTLQPGTYWSSLTINSLSVPSLSSNNNYTLVDISGNNTCLQFNVSGIYQITTSLQFTGISGAQTFAFSYSTGSNSSSNTLSNSTNNIAGAIATYTGSTLTSTPYFINGSSSGGSSGFTTTNFGGNVYLTSGTGNTDPFFILPNNLSNTNSPNANTITSIYYIPAPNALYFNIANTGSGSGLNATGNFTVQLLNYIVGIPNLSNVTNLTISSLQYSNGYYYYTFVPTNTTSSGTATITFSGNVQMSCLLVGGGGGGGGNNISSSSIVSNGGGGGGGGQILNSIISGSTFNLTVGNAGAGGASSVNGTIGGNTSLNSLVVSGGGGGLYTSPGGTNGGGIGATYDSKGNILNYSTSGASGQTITLSGINLSYSVGGAGGGGGAPSFNFPYGGGGGLNNTGGAGGGGTSYVGGAGSGYGTGGGGGGGQYPTNGPYAGGSGFSGFAVIYWVA